MRNNVISQKVLLWRNVPSGNPFVVSDNQYTISIGITLQFPWETDAETVEVMR